jgi:hypothetical protein
MDSDQQKENIETESRPEDDMSFIGNLFQSLGLRYAVRAGDEVDRFFSCNRHYLLLHFNFVFLLILFFIKKRYS